MIEDNYPKAYKEVYEILKYVPEQEKEKIPKKVIDAIKNNMDTNYNFRIEESEIFEEIQLLRETKSILAVIYRDYWANESEKTRILQKQNYDIQKEEEKKQKKYNYDHLFKNKQNNNKEIKELIVYEEQKWYKKFIKFIKNFLWKK